MLTSQSDNSDIVRLLKIVFDEANRTANLTWEVSPNQVPGNPFTLIHTATGDTISKTEGGIVTYKACDFISRLCNSVLMLDTHDWENYRNTRSSFFSPELVNWCNAWNTYIISTPTGLISSIGSLRLGHYNGWMAVK